jgi:hypothetical protein
MWERPGPLAAARGVFAVASASGIKRIPVQFGSRALGCELGSRKIAVGNVCCMYANAKVNMIARFHYYYATHVASSSAATLSYRPPSPALLLAYFIFGTSYRRV